jgi:serine/threonine-protein kinase
MLCSSCHATNRERARFCAACGATLPLLCPRCGTALAPPARFCRKCGTSLQPEEAIARAAGGVIPPGTLLEGRYTIQRLLGQGGFARVYLAHDRLGAGAACAVKELTDNSPENQRQFEREASLLRRLGHPRLVHVTDHFQTAAGDMFLVMDYVEGQDLDTVLDQAAGLLPEARIVQWALQVCDVLEYLHTWVDPSTGKPSPVIHRDIKPGNLKLQPDDGIIVIDLGIAKVKQSGSMTTKAARAVSPPYSPLEQYGQGTDERSDIYALGATLYHLTTGQTPPEAPDLARTPLVPPRILNPALPPYLDQVIVGAMQLDPDARLQTVASLRAALSARAAPPACTYQTIHALLSDALHRHTWVDIVYTKKNGPPRRRSVLPTAVTPSYLYAVERPGGMDLIYRVERISSAAAGEAQPSRPIQARRGVRIRPITDQGARQGPPRWVTDPTSYLASGDWERVPPPAVLPSPAPDDAADLYDRAVASIESSDWTGAVSLLSELLRRRPGYRDAPALLARVQARQSESRVQKLYDDALAALQRKEWTAAIDRFTELQRLSPGYRDAEARLAEARQGQARNASEREQRALRTSALRNDAFWHMTFHRWQPAIAALEEILRNEPGDPSATRLLKDAVRQRDEERVRSLYQQALSAMRQGDEDQAEVFLRTVALYDPGYRDTKQLLARLGRGPSPPSAARPEAVRPAPSARAPVPGKPGPQQPARPARRGTAAAAVRSRPKAGGRGAGCFALIVLGLMIALALYAASVFTAPAPPPDSANPTATAAATRTPVRALVSTLTPARAVSATPAGTATFTPTASPVSTPSPTPSRSPSPTPLPTLSPTGAPDTLAPPTSTPALPRNQLP